MLVLRIDDVVAGSKSGAPQMPQGMNMQGMPGMM